MSPHATSIREFQNATRIRSSAVMPPPSVTTIDLIDSLAIWFALGFLKSFPLVQFFCWRVRLAGYCLF